MTQWSVYLLRCADGSLYCGISTNVQRRLKQHNAGTASKYTRSRLPAHIEAVTDVASKSDALKLEIQVKKQPRNNKITFLLTNEEK